MTIEENEILDGKIKINEKIIQDKVNIFLEEKLNIKIIEEGLDNDFPELQEHKYILKNDLRQGIIDNNKGLIDKLNSMICQDELVEILLNDFLKKFDSCENNINIYELIFIKQNQITFKINNNEIQEYYNVLNFIDYSKNTLTIIKEKKIVDNIILKQFECSDFAIYLNGIPFIAIELKTLESRYEQAILDYSNKKTYHKFLGCLGSDTKFSFISTNPKSSEVFIWDSYGDNSEEKGLKSLLLELIVNKENLLFYFQYCCVIKKENDEIKLQNARVQQYYVTKKYDVIFQNEINKINNVKEQDIIKNYFKHHTRTGKTFTIRLIINLLSKKIYNDTPYSTLFNNIYIMTHDLVVLENMKNELSDHFFGNVYQEYKEIESKQDYKQSIKDIESNKKNIYLTNLQKMDLPDFVINNGEKEREIKDINDTKKILFIIDEVHTHQNINNGYAYVRNALFPNASYITTTATPIYSEIEKDKLWNQTKEVFGEEIDNFTPNDAKRLKIVTNLIYEKYKWTTSGKTTEEIKDIKDKLFKLEENLKNEAKLKILNSDSIKEIIVNKIYEQLTIKKQNEVANIKDLKEFLIILIYDFNYDKNELNNYNGYLEYFNQETLLNTKDILDYIILLLKEKLDKEINNLIEKQKLELETELKKDLIPYKIKIISDDLIKLRKKTYDLIESENKIKLRKNEKLIEQFKPKAFWIVGSIKEGMSIISKIKELNTNEYNKQQNIYNGIRFGLDVSNLGDLSTSVDKEDLDYYSKNKIQFNDINGKYIRNSSNKKRSNAIVDFESKIENDGSIDILIIVGKYLMGYDLKILTKIYLDTNIHDLKKIIQISTRGSTIMPGKDTSFVLDLNLNDDTKHRYFKAMKLFNNEDYQEFCLDQEIIDNNLNELNNSLEKIIESINKQNTFLNENTNTNYKTNYLIDKNTLLENNIEEYFIFTLMSMNIFLKQNDNNYINYEFNNYWEYILKINNILQILKIPKYYITSENEDFLPYLNKIMYINQQYFFKVLYKEQNENKRYTSEEIKKLIQNTFELLSIDFNEKIETTNDIIGITNEDNLIIVDNEIKNMKKLSSLQTTNLKMFELGISTNDMHSFNKILEELEKNNSIIISEELEKNSYLEQQKKFEIEKYIIINNFNNNLNHYIIYQELNKLIQKENINLQLNILNKITKKIEQELESLINIHSNNNSDIFVILQSKDKKDLIYKEMNFNNFGQKYTNGILDNNEFNLFLESTFINVINKESFKDSFYIIMNNISERSLKYDFYYK